MIVIITQDKRYNDHTETMEYGHTYTATTITDGIVDRATIAKPYLDMFQLIPIDAHTWIIQER